MTRALTRLNDGLHRVLRGVLTLLMGLLLVPVVLQIASRFIDALPHLIWTEEAARFCFIWIVMIGAALAVRDGAHFELDLFGRSGSSSRSRRGPLFVHGAMLIVALTFVWFGYSFARLGLSQESELTGLNMLAIHVAWPFAGIVFTLFLAEKIAADLSPRREDGRERS